MKYVWFTDGFYYPKSLIFFGSTIPPGIPQRSHLRFGSANRGLDSPGRIFRCTGLPPVIPLCLAWMLHEFFTIPGYPNLWKPPMKCGWYWMIKHGFVKSPDISGNISRSRSPFWHRIAASHSRGWRGSRDDRCGVLLLLLQTVRTSDMENNQIMKDNLSIHPSILYIYIYRWFNDDRWFMLFLVNGFRNGGFSRIIQPKDGPETRQIAAALDQTRISLCFLKGFRTGSVEKSPKLGPRFHPCPIELVRNWRPTISVRLK